MHIDLPDWLQLTILLGIFASWGFVLFRVWTHNRMDEDDIRLADLQGQLRRQALTIAYAVSRLPEAAIRETLGDVGVTQVTQFLLTDDALDEELNK